MRMKKLGECRGGARVDFVACGRHFVAHLDTFRLRSCGMVRPSVVGGLSEVPAGLSASYQLISSFVFNVSSGCPGGL
jgi:hypothetical protein